MSSSKTHYECELTTNGDISDALDVFEVLVNKIKSALPDFLESIDANKPANERAVYFFKIESSRHNSINARLYQAATTNNSGAFIVTLDIMSILAGQESTAQSNRITDSALSGTAENAIDEIRRGAYSPLPLAQGIARGSATRTILAIENNTAYNLTVYLSGPLDQTVTLAPGERQEVTLAGGQYRMAARVASPGVLPFYGEQTFAAGEYSENFYISAR